MSDSRGTGGAPMQAVIMAGGEGSRLRPLTSNMPKPMLPVANRPLMEHILLLLNRHGFTDVIATVQFLSSVIRNYFGDGSDLGVSLAYSNEEVPLGTAGSVSERPGPAVRPLPGHLRRRPHRHRSGRGRPLAPGQGRGRHDGAETHEGPARVRDRHDLGGRADRALPREADLGSGLHRHDQHRDVRDRAGGAGPDPSGSALRLLLGVVPADARQGPAAVRLRHRGLLDRRRQLGGIPTSPAGRAQPAGRASTCPGSS